MSKAQRLAVLKVLLELCPAFNAKITYEAALDKIEEALEKR